MQTSTTETTVATAREARIIATLQDKCSGLFGYPAQSVSADLTFLALGADSLLLLRLAHAVQEKFKIKVPFRRLMADLNTIGALASHLDQHLPPEEQPQAAHEAEEPPSNLTGEKTGAPVSPHIGAPQIQQIVAQQLKVIGLQLELLRGQTPGLPALNAVQAPTTSVPPAKPIGSQTLSRCSDIYDWTYCPSWMRSSTVAGRTVRPCTHWLIFADTRGVGNELAEQLRSEGATALVVRHGRKFARLSENEWTIHPDRQQDYEKLLADISNVPLRILHFGNFGRPEAMDDFSTIFTPYLSLVFLAKALDAAGSSTELIVVSSQLHDVLGAGTNDPAKALISGPCAAIGKEFSTIQCRSIDFDANGEDRQAKLSVIRQLRHEVDFGSDESSIAYARGQRWVRCFEQVRLPRGMAVPVNEGGVYWITGGLGGLGLCIGEWLVRNHSAKLVLSGRTASAQDPKLQRLRDLGAELMVFSADVSSKSDMSAALERVKARFVRVNGLIHAAGIGTGGFIANEPSGELFALKPKVLGTMVLEHLLQDEPLEFTLLCSSLAAITSSIGRAQYISANAFLDSYAARVGASRDRPVVSVNWDTWRGIGMDPTPERLPAHLRELHKRESAFGMEPAEALELTGAILASRLPRVIVSTRELPILDRIRQNGAAVAPFGRPLE
jgi:phthiocerol/phenolphthiocerol synthesis type-I polyketide synthase E